MKGENFIYSALDGWHREKMESHKISTVVISPSNGNDITDHICKKFTKSTPISKTNLFELNQVNLLTDENNGSCLKTFTYYRKASRGLSVGEIQ